MQQNRSILCFFCLLLLLSIAGCHDGPAGAKADDAKLRSAYEKKSYSLNDVPESQRAIVQGFMKGSKPGAMPSPPPKK